MDVFWPIIEGKYDHCDVEIMYGSRKGAKSHFVWQRELRDCVNASYYKCIVTRKVARTMEESVYESLKETVESMGLSSEFVFKKSPLKVTHIPTNNKFLFCGLDEPQKLKSILNPTRVVFEEAAEISEEDYNTVALTLRSSKVDVLKKILIFNPPEYSGFWVFERFFLNPELHEKADGTHTFMPAKQPGVMILHTCYKHNTTLRPHDIKDFDDIMRLAEGAQTDASRTYYHNMYNRIALGLITDSKTGKEYIKTFSKAVHVLKVDYIEGLPLHFTMDFNVNPYMSGLVIQVRPRDEEWLGYEKHIEIRVFKEYALENPYNSAGDLAKRFTNDHIDNLSSQKAFFLYGDSSGNNTLPLAGVRSLFQDFENSIMSGIGIKKRVPKSNPKYKHSLGKGTLGRRELSNNIFGGSYPVRVMIDKSCVQLVGDLSLCQEDANGKLLKKVKNGIEERGHHLQALEYFYCHKDSFGYLSKQKI